MTTFFEQYDLIAKSGWFDAAFYISLNPEVAAAGMDPVLHYLESGAAAGRQPHPDFDVGHYQQQCAARGIAVLNPLLHFLEAGEQLGLQPNAGPLRRSAPGATEQQVKLLLASGLFDAGFYCNAYNLNFETERDALRDFLNASQSEHRRPNLYFDPNWYLGRHPAIKASGTHPLLHFLQHGDAEGLQPSLLFDARGYRQRYDIPKAQNTLAHYLKHASSCRFTPIPDFDVAFYAKANKDVRDAGVDPFAHFLMSGYREGRNPSETFSLRYYSKRYLNGESRKINPFLHYLQHKHEPGVFGVPPEDEPSVHRAIKHFSKPSPHFEACAAMARQAPAQAKVLAYYLPQFHPFAENNAWWGTGFTEWTNVPRGVSRYRGHYQPRIPRDLGFYSLDDASAVLRRQVALAQAGGVHGFVFYYYWFNGKRLMERPVEAFLGATDIQMPFCLMWANENWTRRWDGDEHDVLISQDYDPDDDAALLADFARHFADPRYIRVGGRPLLIIYRPGIIPNAKSTLKRWRRLFRDRFGESPIMIMAQAFNDEDPDVFGLDGAIEFPPHKLTANMPTVNDDKEYLDYEFSGQIFSYDAVIERSLNEPAPAYPLIKTAVPSWDNDARRQGTGLILDGSTPAKYEAWMKGLIQHAQAHPFFGEHFVAVNAWNEWGEAAYLEPDLHFGGAYLNATARAVTAATASPAAGAQPEAGEAVAEHGSAFWGVPDPEPGAEVRGNALLLVGHDAFPSGAQMLLLNIAKRLRSAHGIEIEIILLADGGLLPAYRELAPVVLARSRDELIEAIRQAHRKGFRNAIVNTIGAAHVLPWLQEQGIAATSLIHELPRVMRELHLEEGARAAFGLSRQVVVASPAVSDALAAELGITLDARVRILPQGIYKKIESSAKAVSSLRKELGLRAGDKLVVGVGYADLRKGFDLFLQLWRTMQAAKGRAIHFCWIGDVAPVLKDWLSVEIKAALDSGTLHLPGHRQDVAPYLFAADAFVLTSREDPFPTVVHEALSAGLPVVVFEGSGGMPAFLRRHRMGAVVPYSDVAAMAKALRAGLSSKRPGESERRKAFVKSELDFGVYVRRLLQLALPDSVPVSVAVPNFNYAQFMDARLSSIFRQTHPLEEVLVLDDCSTDNSLQVVPALAEAWHRDVRVLRNRSNSGSVFKQWRKAAETARGRYIWIAEADDLAEPRFLQTVMAAMQADSDICMGFSDSRSITQAGQPLWPDYKDYYAQQGAGTLAQSQVFTGREFLRELLSVRNLILNVSSVVWRRDALLEALDRCAAQLASFRMAGDWRLYAEVLSRTGAKIAYVAEPLNVHRRHEQSVTHRLDAREHVAEVQRCHEVLAEKLGLSQAQQHEQAQYREQLQQQFGITTRSKSPRTAKTKIVRRSGR